MTTKCVLYNRLIYKYLLQKNVGTTPEGVAQHFVYYVYVIIIYAFVPMHRTPLGFLCLAHDPTSLLQR